MPPKKLEGVKIHIEHSLLSSSLGSLVSEALQQLDAEVDGAAHPIEYTITWEPRGDAHVLVILDESTPFRKHAEEMRLHFPGRRIAYIVQGLEDIDQELVRLQTSTDCLTMETSDAEETAWWIAQLLIDACTDIKRAAMPRVRSGHDATDTWRLMLLKIHGVSDTMAAAIVRVYPTTRSLSDAYDKLTSTDAEKLLTQILVSGKRKICIAVSTRIHRFFTCDDPQFRINVHN